MTTNHGHDQGLQHELILRYQRYENSATANAAIILRNILVRGKLDKQKSHTMTLRVIDLIDGNATLHF